MRSRAAPARLAACRRVDCVSSASKRAVGFCGGSPKTHSSGGPRGPPSSNRDVSFDSESRGASAVATVERGDSRERSARLRVRGSLQGTFRIANCPSRLVWTTQGVARRCHVAYLSVWQPWFLVEIPRASSLARWGANPDPAPPPGTGTGRRGRERDRERDRSEPSARGGRSTSCTQRAAGRRSRSRSGTVYLSAVWACVVPEDGVGSEPDFHAFDAGVWRPGSPESVESVFELAVPAFDFAS